MFMLGLTQRLVIKKNTEHGLYLAETMDSRDEILLPGKEAPDGAAIGDEISVFIYRDSKDRLIATTLVPKITLHQVALLKVVSVSKIGAFADWGLQKDLLLPYKEQTKRVKEGEDILVALYIDKSGRLCLTMNVYEYLSTDSPYKKDDHVSGRIYQISERFGAFVAVDNKYSALIPQREVMPEHKIGHEVSARVTEVREDGKLTLSAKEKAYLQMDADAEKVYKLIVAFDGVLPFSDNASPETIKRELGMSKNAFKRAVGKLYKERKIDIKEKSIVLTDR